MCLGSYVMLRKIVWGALLMLNVFGVFMGFPGMRRPAELCVWVAREHNIVFSACDTCKH